MPLISRGELIGTINLAPDEPGTLTPELEDTLRQVADQLAIAIQQARLREQVQRHAEELEQRVADRTRELLAMYEVMAIASQSLDLETTLDRTLERVLEAVDSDIGTIHLLDDEEETLHLAAERGVPTGFIDLIRTMPAREGLDGWVIQHGEPLLVHDISSDPRLDARLRAAPFRYVGVPMRAGGRALGVLSTLREAAQPQFGAEEVALIASLADRVGAVVESSQLRARAEQAAVLEERHRLARELHDSVTQSLYSATLMAETGQLATGAGDMDVVGNCLARLGDVTQQALKEMRLLIYELRPPELEQEGLIGALQQRLDAVEARAGTEARLLTQGEIELDVSQEEALYRIALEALNNILKHASATAVTVRVFAEGQSVCLEVADDGRGFAPQAVADKGGMGLVTMRERAERMGGRLTIQSAPGEGTEVRVEVPGGTS
jgi:signal transduction histidine kinase